MANKRPLSLATETPSAIGSNGVRKQRCFEIKPVIMKRSQIYNNCAPVVMFHNSTNNKHEAPSDLQSCLRGPSQALRQKSQSLSSRQTSEACSVQFRPNVTVRRIPSRHEYSVETRKELWSGLEEIRVNALRNEAEFMFDGCDWRECSEEEAMYYDQRNSCLVHPAHVDTVCVYNGQDWKPISKDSSNELSSSTSGQKIVRGYAGEAV